ncbi:MAG: hypothetical protein ABEJ26_03805 [Halosimplex sp.]
MYRYFCEPHRQLGMKGGRGGGDRLPVDRRGRWRRGRRRSGYPDRAGGRADGRSRGR